MKKLSWFAATLLIFLPLISQANESKGDDWEDVGPPIVVTTHVDANGQVTQAEMLSAGALPQLEALATQTVRRWRFVPATVNGVPTDSLTYVELMAQKREAAGLVSLRLHYLSHGPGPTYRATPRYPPAMIHARVQAQLILSATVTESGTYTDVRVVSARTSNGEAGKSFYDEAIRAFTQSKVLPEQVGGRPVVTRIRVPMTFHLQMDGAPIEKDFTKYLERAADSPHEASVDETNSPTTFADVPIALDSPLKLVATPP